MTPNEFPAPWLLRGPHVETILPALWPARRLAAEEEELVVPVAPGNAVTVRLARSEPGADGRGARGTVLLVHGLGGDVEAPYMRRTGRHALERGWCVARMNLRNCGGSEALATTLYNAGQGADVGRVLARLDELALPRPLACIGFSLGGAMALAWAGAAGASAILDALVAVNPPVELEACVRELERPVNALYHRRFVACLCGQLRAVRRVRAHPGPPARARRIRTLRRFDDLFTAPDAGYADSAEYYERASAAPLLSAIRRPALILAAVNDPFVPLASVARHHAAASEHVVFAHPPHGGHVGYFQRGRPRFWAAAAALDFLEGAAARSADPAATRAATGP